MHTDGPVPSDEDENEGTVRKPINTTKLVFRPIVMKDETLESIEEHSETPVKTEELTCVGPKQATEKSMPVTPVKRGSVAEKIERLTSNIKDDKAVDKGKGPAVSNSRPLVQAIDKSTVSEASSAAEVSKEEVKAKPTVSAAAKALRKVSEPKRAGSPSPSKSVASKSSRHPKLKPDVPEFVPRHLRTSTDASNDFTPGTPGSIGSASSSPSRLRAHAPEFVSKRVAMSTDASSNSIPKSVDPREPRPLSPAKRAYQDIPAGSPGAGRSAKIHRPEFDRSFHLSTSVSSNRGEASDSSCPRFRDGRQSPAPKVVIDTTNKPKSPEKSDGSKFVRPRSRIHRRNMSKSEPASQMGSTVDGGQDSENSIMSPIDQPPSNIPTPSMGNRRVTAPSDPPTGEQTSKLPQKAGGRPKTPVAGRRRHWRYKNQGGSRSSGLSSRQSSVDGSADTGRVPRPPNGSPTMGPVPSYVYQGMS